MNKIIGMINNADSIVILAHDNEDADAVGSCNAMRRMLLGLNKNAACVFSDRLEHRLEFMDEGYTLFDGQNIPKADLCICLDCADADRMGKRKAIFDAAASTVCIDHHATNVGFADVNFIDADAPATGEILYELFIKMGAAISRDVAKNLYAAISSDSGSFKYSNVRPRTLVIASELLSYDINHAEIARRLYDTETISAMHFKGYLMSHVEQYLGGRLNMVCAPQGLLDEYNVDEKDTGDIVNIPRMVEGCEIAVSVREYSDKIKVSFRSNGRYDVSEICMKLGGGGHKMAAGASVEGKTMEEVKRLVIKNCEEAVNG